MDAKVVQTQTSKRTQHKYSNTLITLITFADANPLNSGHCFCSTTFSWLCWMRTFSRSCSSMACAWNTTSGVNRVASYTLRRNWRCVKCVCVKLLLLYCFRSPSFVLRRLLLLFGCSIYPSCWSSPTLFSSFCAKSRRNWHSFMFIITAPCFHSGGSLSSGCPPVRVSASALSLYVSSVSLML